ncbi:MAG: HpcH/HpaI aldolase/citrate lyase family protein [Nitratireductor sp.]
MELAKNRFKQGIADGDLQIGLWSSLCSNMAAEGLAHSGFDWIVIDMEHAPNEIPNVISQLQAMTGGTATPLVRPQWNDFVLIKRLLDAGAQSLIIPYVQNREEAEQAVAATRYPPLGIRGVSGSSRSSMYGRVKDYFHKAQDELCVIVQVETAEALEQLEEIASVDGVDGVFIGPADLSASLGYLGNMNADEVQAAIRGAVERLARIGKPAGILSASEDDCRRYIEWGFTFVAVGIDTGLLVRTADALARKFGRGD